MVLLSLLFSSFASLLYPQALGRLTGYGQAWLELRRPLSGYLSDL